MSLLDKLEDIVPTIPGGTVSLTFLACSFPSTDKFMLRRRTQRSTPPWLRFACLALCFEK